MSPVEGSLHRGLHAVSCNAIGKSGRVLYAFSRFYLPFYGQDPSDIFWQYDPLACISALVYDIDEGVEAGLIPETTNQRIDGLIEWLQARIVFDSKFGCLIRDARRYYEFEHEVVRTGSRYTLGDLVEITGIRSFDFRLMHRALAQLSGVGYREKLFEWFRAFEMLMEIEDDLESVEEDSIRCTFNIASLASKVSSDDGLAFVFRARERAEQAIQHLMAGLPAVEREVCNSTLAAYRAVVPVPIPGTGTAR